MKYRLKYLLLTICFTSTWIDVENHFIGHKKLETERNIDREKERDILRDIDCNNSVDDDKRRTLKTNDLKFRCDYKYCRSCKGWFKYHKIPANFQDARLRCDLEGAVLASPTTPEIRSAMARSSGRIPILTGIHATFSQGDYTTVDGTPLEEFPHEWIKTDIVNDMETENCLSINAKGSLNDVPCDLPRPFMCYREKIQELNSCGTPDPEYHLDSGTQKCYKFHTTPRSFKRAFMACSAEGGHLAIINNDEEAKVIEELFEKYPPEQMVGDFPKDFAFLGVTDWNEHGDWRTIHGQTLADAGYSKFIEEESVNSTLEFCATVTRAGVLKDANCDDFFAFICEKRPKYPPVCSISL